MRIISQLMLLTAISFSAHASDEITIHVKELTYTIGKSERLLTHTELEKELIKLNFSKVVLDVDYCAEPLTLANVYLAIANNKPLVKDIKLTLSGSHEESKCENI